MDSPPVPASGNGESSSLWARADGGATTPQGGLRGASFLSRAQGNQHRRWISPRWPGFGAINGEAAFNTAIVAVARGEVATLAHEAGDHAVEGAALEVQRLAELAHALLAGAEAAEVLGRARHYLGEKRHLDSAGRFAIERDVEEDRGV